MKGQEAVGPHSPGKYLSPACMKSLASLLAYTLFAPLLAYSWNQRALSLQDATRDLFSAWNPELSLQFLRTGGISGSSFTKLGHSLVLLAGSADLLCLVWLYRMLCARYLLYQIFRDLQLPYGRSGASFLIRKHSSLVTLKNPRRSLFARIMIICFCLDNSMYCRGMLLLVVCHECGPGNLSWWRHVWHAISDTCICHGALQDASVRPSLWVWTFAYLVQLSLFRDLL